MKPMIPPTANKGSILARALVNNDDLFCDHILEPIRQPIFTIIMLAHLFQTKKAYRGS